VPALTSSVLAAASLLGGVYIVEIVFNMHGVSELITEAVQQQTADAPAALGFTVYNILAVLLLMFVLDVLQAVIDPRMREKVQV
jgi:ABC-type dipeptide/oligopeptide/nickel transport system permease component